MAIQAIIAGLFSSIAGLLLLLAGIITAVVLLLLRRGIQNGLADKDTKKTDNPDA